MRHRLAITLTGLLLPVAAQAAETIVYTYDAAGRLTRADHSGAVNNGLSAAYAYDKAGNRVSVNTTGAAARVVVVPLKGMTVIPLGDPAVL